MGQTVVPIPLGTGLKLGTSQRAGQVKDIGSGVRQVSAFAGV